MIKDKLEILYVIKCSIEKIVRKVEKDPRLKFDKDEKLKILNLLKNLESQIVKEPEIVYSKLVELNMPARVFGFENELKIIKRYYMSFTQKLVNNSAKSLAYI